MTHDCGYSVSRFKDGFGAEDSVFFFFIVSKKASRFGGEPKGRGRFSFLRQTSDMMGNVTGNQERRFVKTGSMLFYDGSRLLLESP